MTKDNTVINKLMEHPRIRSLGLKTEVVVAILRAYSDIALDNLLENGHIELGNGLIIDVVQLVDRVHVLRGTTYNSSRKYKLKLTMEDTMYTRISAYYDKLREDIS